MDLRAVVGRNIRRLRKEKGLQQDALAHDAGVHPTYMSGIENGRRNMTLAVLERVARSLGVPESELVDRQDSLC
jgi:transcriptional regulator with XRE-family HTH domain